MFLQNTQLLPLHEGTLVHIKQLDGGGCQEIFAIVYVVSDDTVVPPDS